MSRIAGEEAKEREGACRHFAGACRDAGWDVPVGMRRHVLQLPATRRLETRRGDRLGASNLAISPRKHPQEWDSHSGSRPPSRVRICPTFC
jgi:hypothetical protein